MIKVEIDPKSLIGAVTQSQAQPTQQVQQEPAQQVQQAPTEPKAQAKPVDVMDVLTASLEFSKKRVEDNWNRLMELLR